MPFLNTFICQNFAVLTTILDLIFFL